MKLIKFLIWIIIIGLFGLVLFQNWDLFKIKESLDINLYFTAYQTPELPMALPVTFMFLFGWLVAYLSGLADRFGLNRRNKKMQQTIIAQQAAIDAMRKDVEALKPKPETPVAPLPAASEAVAENADSDSDTAPPPVEPSDNP